MTASATISQFFKTTSAALVALLLLATGAHAQVTLDQSHIESLVGQVYDVDEYVAADFDEALVTLVSLSGENQTWDFRTVSYADTVDASFHIMMMPAQTPLADDAAFASADYVIENIITEIVDGTETDSTFWTYHSVNADSASSHGGVYIFTTDIDEDGVAPDTVTTTYNPPRKELVFPLSYGTTWQQTADVSGGGGITTSYEVDAYGTVIAPNGETSECLRIKKEYDQFTTVSYEFVCEDSNISASLSSLTSGGLTIASGSISVWTLASAVARDEVAAPGGYRLTLDGSNPFSDRTRVTLHLDRSETVQMALYDMAGRLVRQLEAGRLPAGTHPVEIDGRDLSSGTYLLRAEAGGIVRSELLVRVR